MVKGTAPAPRPGAGKKQAAVGVTSSSSAPVQKQQKAGKEDKLSSSQGDPTKKKKKKNSKSKSPAGRKRKGNAGSRAHSPNSGLGTRNANYVPPPVVFDDPDAGYFDNIRQKVAATQKKLQERQREREQEQFLQMQKSLNIESELLASAFSGEFGGSSGIEESDNNNGGGRLSPTSQQRVQDEKTKLVEKMTETFAIPPFITRKPHPLNITLMFDKDLSSHECRKETNITVLEKIRQNAEISALFRKAFLAALGEDYGEKLTALQFKYFIRDSKLVDLGVSVSAMNIMYSNVTKPLTYMNETSFVLALYFLAAMVVNYMQNKQRAAAAATASGNTTPHGANAPITITAGVHDPSLVLEELRGSSVVGPLMSDPSPASSSRLPTSGPTSARFKTKTQRAQETMLSKASDNPHSNSQSGSRRGSCGPEELTIDVEAAGGETVEQPPPPALDDLWILQQFGTTILEPYLREYLPQWCDPTTQWSEASPGCDRLATMYHKPLREIFDLLSEDESSLKKYAKPLPPSRHSFQQSSPLAGGGESFTDRRHSQSARGRGGRGDNNNKATKPAPPATTTGELFKPGVASIIDALSPVLKQKNELAAIQCVALPTRHEHHHAIGANWNTFTPLSAFSRLVSSMRLPHVSTGDVVRVLKACSNMHPEHHFRQRMTPQQKARSEEEPFLLFPEFVDALVRISVVAFRPTNVHVGAASHAPGALDEANLSSRTLQRLRATRQRTATGIAQNERAARATACRTLVDAFRTLLDIHVSDVYQEATQLDLKSMTRELPKLDIHEVFLAPPVAHRLLPPGSTTDDESGGGETTTTVSSRPSFGVGFGPGIGSGDTMALSFRPLKNDVIVQNPMLRQELTLVGDQFEPERGLVLALTTPAMATLLDTDPNTCKMKLNTPGAQRYISANTTVSLSISNEGMFGNSSDSCQSYLRQPLMQIRCFEIIGTSCAKFIVPALSELKTRVEELGQPFYRRMAVFCKTDAAKRTRVFRHRIFSFHIHYSNDGKRWISSRSIVAVKNLSITARLSDPHVVKYNDPLPPETIPPYIVGAVHKVMRKVAVIKDPLNSGFVTKRKFEVVARRIWQEDAQVEETLLQRSKSAVPPPSEGGTNMASFKAGSMGDDAYNNIDGTTDLNRNNNEGDEGEDKEDDAKEEEEKEEEEGSRPEEQQFSLTTDIHLAFRSNATVCGTPPEPQYREALGIDEFLSALLFLYRRDFGMDVECPPARLARQKRTKPTKSRDGVAGPEEWWDFLSETANVLDTALEEEPDFYQQCEFVAGYDAKPVIMTGSGAGNAMDAVEDRQLGIGTGRGPQPRAASLIKSQGLANNPERLIQELQVVLPRPKTQLDIYQGPFKVGWIESCSRGTVKLPPSTTASPSSSSGQGLQPSRPKSATTFMAGRRLSLTPSTAIPTSARGAGPGRTTGGGARKMTQTIQHHDFQVRAEEAKKTRDAFLYQGQSSRPAFDEFTHDFFSLEGYQHFKDHSQVLRVLRLNLPLAATLARLLYLGLHFLPATPSGTPNPEILRVRLWKLMKRSKKQDETSQLPGSGSKEEEEKKRQHEQATQDGGTLGGDQGNLDGKCVGCLANIPGQLSTLGWVPMEGDLCSPIASLCLYYLTKTDPHFAAVAAAFLTNQDSMSHLRSALGRLGFDLEVIHPI